MISVSEAKQIILTNVESLAPVDIALQNASGLVLAENIYASVDIPPFNQSSVDGYAFAYDSFLINKRMAIAAEIIPAGFDKSFKNITDKAVRIFTGAPVPASADTVVMQENVIVENKNLVILHEQLIKGSNIRPAGAEIKSGTLALPEKTFLSPAAIGFLAGIGVSQVKVFPNPAISIIVTGKELQQPGKQLQPGQVYQSNSYMLKAALQQLNILNVEIFFSDDNLDFLQQTLTAALQTSDVVLLTGGVSVGDYDFVVKAAGLCGVKQLFHKVRQRPGKPLYFGKKGQKTIFGLPGNPSSVLTCFYEYVIPAIERLTRRENIIKTEHLILEKAISKRTNLTHFLKGKKKGNMVSPLDAQESYRLSSFANADCLICLPQDQETFKEGELVEIHLLP